MNPEYKRILMLDFKFKAALTEHERIDWSVTRTEQRRAQNYLTAKKMCNLLPKYYGRSEVCDSVN